MMRISSLVKNFYSKQLKTIKKKFKMLNKAENNKIKVENSE